MKPPFPSLTPTWRNDTYDLISPTRPELSMAGKTVVVTGAAAGIGLEIARSYAQAGAKRVAVIDRPEANFDDAAKALRGPAGHNFSFHAANVKDLYAMRKAAAEIGEWDVLFMNAGFLAQPGSVREVDVEEWWEGFGTNVRGAFVTAQSFLPTANIHPSTSNHSTTTDTTSSSTTDTTTSTDVPSQPTIIAMTSSVICFPASTFPGNSSYVASKMALNVLMDHLAVENPDKFVATMSPGIVGGTALADKMGVVKTGRVPVDSINLPAHFALWLSSPEASFLRGKSVWANWDVAELKERAREIENDRLLTTPGLVGFPWVEMGQEGGLGGGGGGGFGGSRDGGRDGGSDGVKK
ncbi:MAG: hypothetical protein M1831_003644 [Alyxoria varia]|nr:MAG: hypothetical protein M1831_003644 [Alyxoria varia]